MRTRLLSLLTLTLVALATPQFARSLERATVGLLRLGLRAAIEKSTAVFSASGVDSRLL